MKRLMIALALTAMLSFAAGCGSHEEDESQFIATAVPTYTVVAPGTSQTTAPAPATEEEHAADGEPEETAETVVDAVAAVTAVEAEIAEETVEEKAEEAVEEPESTPVSAVAESAVVDSEATESEATESGDTESGDTQSGDTQSDETMAEEPVNEQAASSEATGEEDTVEADEASDVHEDIGSAEGNTEEADIYAGLPEAIAALMPGADPVHGEQLSLMNGCIGCHNLDPALVMAGPTWYNIGTTAETRVEGKTAAQYLHTSIVNPNDYVVEGFAPKIMISTYGETLSEQDQADLVAYLLSLHE